MVLRNFIATPPADRVLGLALRPFAVGHWIALYEMESAFVRADSEAIDLLNDLPASVLTCALPPLGIAKELRRSTTRLFCYLWARKTRKLDHVEEARRFSDYIRKSTELPMFSLTSEPSGKQAEAGAPPPWRIRCMLVAEFGLSIPEADAMPVAEANLLWVTEAERQGRVSIASPRRLAWYEAVRAAEAARKSALAEAETTGGQA